MVSVIIAFVRPVAALYALSSISCSDVALLVRNAVYARPGLIVITSRIILKPAAFVFVAHVSGSVELGLI